MSPSARHLLLSNASTLAAGLLLHWNVGWLLWPYWMQSVIIGWYARKRMLALGKFSTKGFTSNGRPVPENVSGKRSTAIFFSIHYGFVHLGYLAFLIGMHAVESWRDIFVLFTCGVSFVLSQQQTYAAQHTADLRGKPNLGTLMFTPYLRVVPMHIAIIVGSAATGTWMLFLFTGLKTASDLLLDMIDRKMAVASADRASAAVKNPSSPDAAKR